MNNGDRNWDVLVIGGGLAGARAALAARQGGSRVTLVSKGQVGYCGSSAGASGGFAAAIGEPDTIDAHVWDTLRGGYGINSRELVELVCKEAPASLDGLRKLGFEFVSWQQGKGGFGAPGHSRARSIRFKDGGMWVLMRRMRDTLISAGVALLERHHVVDLLLTEEGEVGGALIYDRSRCITQRFRSASVVLATGGCGRVYAVTTNKQDATGDGYAIALRAGIPLRDMEFIQFTPTSFAYPLGLRGITVSGALLSQPNVRLLNRLGERFMTRYAPNDMEAAVRAVVAHAIWREIKEGRGTVNGGVLLDLTALPETLIDALKPGLVKLLESHGINSRQNPVEIAPSAHYCMGGIAVDRSLTPRSGLFIAGEVIGGTHGANRLSSNSLTEANVTGFMAGRYAAAKASVPSAACPLHPAVGLPQWPARGDATLDVLRDDLQILMSEVAGLERTGLEMERGLGKLEVLRHEHGRLAAEGVQEVGEWLDMRNMLTVSEAILRSALMREESRGCHQRSDFPRKDERWWGSTYIEMSDGGLQTRFRPLAENEHMRFENSIMGKMPQQLGGA